MMSHLRPRHLTATCMVAALALAGPLASGAAAVPHGKPDKPDFTLTILHNNDGESKLLGVPGQEDFGGVARFATLVGKLRKQATSGKPGPGQAARRGVVLLSSGDNFLAGPEFTASLSKGVPFYDALALKAIGYDAIAIGNHEFDFGPDVLADFIESFGKNPPPFLSANLDVGDEPRLNQLARKGAIVASATVTERGEKIGVVGATTPALASISSPRRVKVLQNVAELIQAEVDRLTRRGIDKIILISHLQGLGEDRELVPLLRNVDVAIAGGGDELLASDTTPLVPGDAVSTDPATGQKLRYPLHLKDKAGVDVPVVTTAGDYKYVGRLVVNFDAHGRVLSVDPASGPVRVSGVAPDAVAPDPKIQRTVVEPVSRFVEGMAANVVAQSEVALEGRREPGVRTQETNLGNLVADALLAAGRKNAAAYGVQPPDVALQNGGGIRNNTLIPAGPITELDTFAIAPFGNFVSVVPNVPRAQFKEILENAVSRLPAADGRFAQVAGFRFSYDPSGTAQVVDDDGTVLTPGSRIRSVVLDDGTVIVENGRVVPGPDLSVATNDFSARGGDQWPFRGLPFTTVGLTYQQALASYLTDDLGGRITAADYPEGGSGRITAVP
ncbi:5'-Nucleotidase domain protein [Thermomonospora curvata DSM 43183]|uniref:5'-Nucleotidase domain protein n=1 Tax=Thermomonospora curvata (strain ATCC 19995 / DSM 43183 / JCM 3096 / KCTC 9072 / NBRC 15933 / NCIMB 10081 / Henssen B9) TaxID=471852 RepID=D1A9C2_THECD|nr:5'-Nucleotidase domain protein [Thermomonospora curvata DSM 43183]PKK15113.1 MAG: bifunctional metallophosphatase/5'-nucleotidase [Thermomonospora sp. CIF 1]